ncbi:MAG: efflux RND transporter periplasmic adaptor subunit [Gammaproteobacteria bacterium]
MRMMIREKFNGLQKMTIAHGIVATVLVLIVQCAISREMPPSPVRVETVLQKPMAPTIWVAGTVLSRHDARISAEITGRLDWIVEVGATVDKGEDIAHLDDTQLLLQREEFEADVVRSEARVNFLVQEVKRLLRLAKKNNAAQTLLDQTAADRDIARGDLASAKARLKQVQDRLARSKVKAPFSGSVVQRLMQAGEWADSGDELVHLVDAKTIEIQSMVPLASMPYLIRGEKIAIRSGGLPGIATIRSLVDVGDARSRLLDLRLDFTEQVLPVGQTVRVAVPTAALRTVTVVHRDALVLRRDGVAVFVVNDEGIAERVEVTTGIAQGRYIEVLGDIKPGDRVVTRGGERLRPGQKVQLMSFSQNAESKKL